MLPNKRVGSKRWENLGNTIMYEFIEPKDEAKFEQLDGWLKGSVDVNN